LFWYYSSLKGFAIQWGLMNFVFAILIFASFDKIFKIIPNSIQLTKWIPQVSLLAAITGGNVWVFYKMPEGMHLGYWFLPGILYLIAMALVRHYAQKYH
jgi:hypothetical protein